MLQSSSRLHVVIDQTLMCLEYKGAARVVLVLDNAEDVFDTPTQGHVGH